MKRMRKILITIISIVVCFISSLNPKTTITTTAKEYKTGAGANNVSTRDLAMLASLVYEDVPNDNIYKNSDRKQGCITKTGSLIKNCFYKAYDEYVELKDNPAISLSKNNEAFQYVEGMSKRKIMSIVSTATSSFQEDGEKYYFLNFAKTKELENEGWTIFDYGTTQTETGSKIEKILEIDNINFKGVFDAVTFKKGDNYVIAYRGTDYPDLLEWIQDVGYAFNGEHAEAAMAYQYASDVYDAIPKNKNTKIYVTGHSLGAYLAQVGGAAIINKEAGIDVTTTTAKAYQTYTDYKEDYHKKTSYLEQVAYFNGMGVGGVFLSNDFIKQVQNALVYLSAYSKDGQLATSGRNLNYTNNVKSSGRLVSYEMDGDPISAIGLHYGEIYKLETGADAITNHRGRHENPIGEALPEVFSGLTSLLNELDKISVSLTTSETIKLLKMSLSYNLEQAPEGGNIPTTIVNQLKNEYNIDINRFNLGSLVNNLNADLDSFGSKYGITNLFDHFNVNHETDSFACIKDANNGYIDNVKLEVSSKGFNCEGLTCYTNKDYKDNGFVFNEKVITNNYQGNNITLSAKIKGACAKQYTWYASPDGINWTNLGTTIDNKIIIPESIFGTTEEGSKEYYFKVAALYGDSFTEVKSTFNTDSTIIRYQRATEYQTNPTINDSVKSTGKTSVESLSTNVMLVTDRTKPSCTTSKSPQQVELNCAIGGSFCTEITKNISVVCTDQKVNSASSNFKDDSAQLTINTKDTGLIDSIKLLKDKFKTDRSGTTLTYKIPVSINRVPSYKVPKVVIKGDVTDRAGNKTTVNKTIEYKITKKK